MYKDVSHVLRTANGIGAKCGLWACIILVALIVISGHTTKVTAGEINGNVLQQLGQFRVTAGPNGQPIWYFALSNPTGFPFSDVSIICLNQERGETKAFGPLNIIGGNEVCIGPREGWFWQPGEQASVKIPGVGRQTWTFQPIPNFGAPQNQDISPTGYQPQPSAGKPNIAGMKMILQKMIQQRSDAQNNASRMTSIVAKQGMLETIRKYDQSIRDLEFKIAQAERGQ